MGRPPDRREDLADQPPVPVERVGTGRRGREEALGLLDAALMMSEATLPGEQCWRSLREVSDDQPLPYFSTILVNKQWEEA